jgi:hypothetical protein
MGHHAGRSLHNASNHSGERFFGGTMVEGLWIVQYEGTQGEGAGVVVFVQGRVLGGDFGYTYEGNYIVKDGWMAASIHVANFLPNIASVLGIVGDFDLQMKAPIKDNVIQATLSLVGQPNVSIAARLTKKVNL